MNSSSKDPIGGNPLSPGALDADPVESVIVKIIGPDTDGPKVVVAGVNTAVSECNPADNLDVVPAAVPLLTLTGLPSLVVPSLNCTVPVAFTGITDAVNVTGAPWATREAGDVVNVVTVAAGAKATLWECRGLPSASIGAALAGPPTNNNAPRTAAVTGTAPTVDR
jgi:hypothetical protein